MTDDFDMNVVLSGVFALNGFKCFKCLTAEEALYTFDKHIEKVDSILVDGKIAADRETMLIVKSKAKKRDLKIMVIANNTNNKTRILDYGADELLTKPMSAENLANRMIILLARRDK